MSYTRHPSLGAESAVGGVADRPAFFSAFESPRTVSVMVNAPCRDIIIPSSGVLQFPFLVEQRNSELYNSVFARC